MNILIIGHGRHGKDTVAEYFAEKYPDKFKFLSSSLAAAKIFIYKELAPIYNYSSFEECYEDRHNRRTEWYNLICDYNKNDKTRLAREILMGGTNCYVGMRDADEIEACVKNNVFDVVIWVDASERYPDESQTSFNISRRNADIIIDNNGTYDELKAKLDRIGNILFGDADYVSTAINSDASYENLKIKYLVTQ